MFNAFNLQELWNAAYRNPKLRVHSSLAFGKHWEARAQRAKSRWAKRKAKRHSQ